MLNRLFRDHPRAVGESYGEHLFAASGFGISMMLAGLACVIHAIIPALFVTTASRVVDRLHDQLVVNRRRRSGENYSPLSNGPAE